MNNIVNIEDFKSGMKCAFFTACGIYNGLVVETTTMGGEAWINLSDVDFYASPEGLASGPLCKMQAVTIQLNHVVACSAGLQVPT